MHIYIAGLPSEFDQLDESRPSMKQRFSILRITYVVLSIGHRSYFPDMVLGSRQSLTRAPDQYHGTDVGLLGRRE